MCLSKLSSQKQNKIPAADAFRSTNYVEASFRRFRSGTFDAKDAPRTGRPLVKNVDKIPEIIEVDRHVGSCCIAHKLQIDQKTALSHLRKVGFKKKLHVWVPRHSPLKDMMNGISICEALAKRNEIDPFLNRMVTGDVKWVSHCNIVQKRSWSKCVEAAQMLAKPGLTASKVLLCIWWGWKGIIFLGVASAWANTKLRSLLSTAGPFEARD
ncbi:histone-lysine N-methyltransferase SETMAR [Trichonephila clavipes]|nr:histone-lysine N-methyltransferase SETMAR [Trichonephila clavipes]